MRLDLPTLERPEKAISSPSIGGSAGSEAAGREECPSEKNRFPPAPSLAPGEGGDGLSFICTHMVTPMTSGQAPSIRKLPISGTCEGSKGISPNRLKTVVGSGAERSLIQPKNGAWRISMVTNSTL